MQLSIQLAPIYSMHRQVLEFGILIHQQQRETLAGLVKVLE